MIEELYREELRRLHDAGRSFAGAHPQAQRWIGAPGADPDVDRLLEGVAFLAARIRSRIAALDDEVAQGLCEALLPTALRPLPALAMLRFSPVRGLRETAMVRAGTVIESRPVDGEPCRFRLAWDVQVPPLAVAAVQLHAGEHPRLEIHLSVGDGVAPRDVGNTLRLHAAGEASLAGALIRALATARSLHGVDAAGIAVPLHAAWIGPGQAPGVLPGDSGLARGHAILAECLAWPELGRFIDIAGPPGLGLQPGGRGMRIVAELDALPAGLRGVVAEDLQSGCVPALNLWPADAEPVLVDGSRREFALSVAGHRRASPWSVLAVRGGRPGRTPRPWLHARAAADGPRWQELHRTSGPELAIGGLDEESDGEVLSIDILAHEPDRAGRIGTGDLCVPGMAVPGSLAVANLRPPARPLPSPTGSRRLQMLAGRLRCAAAGIRDRETLAALLDLHDRRSAAEAVGRTSGARVAAGVRALAIHPRAVPWDAAAARALVHEIAVDHELLGGAAATWVLGCSLDHALAALAPLGTVTAVEMRLDGDGGILRWPPRCAGATG